MDPFNPAFALGAERAIILFSLIIMVTVLGRMIQEIVTDYIEDKKRDKE